MRSEAVFAPSDFFHVGVVVDNLEKAIVQYQDTGYTFATQVRRRVPLLDPSGRRADADVVMTYSTNSDFKVELIERNADAPWSVLGVHHFGVWVDTLAEGLAAAATARWQRSWAGAGDDGLPARVAFVVMPDTGTLIELVDRSVMKDQLERWWAGATYLAQ